MYHFHKEYFSLTEKNILQHQRFRAFGTYPDPYYSQLYFDEAAKLFHKLGKVVALIMLHSRLPSMNVHDLAYQA